MLIDYSSDHSSQSTGELWHKMANRFHFHHVAGEEEYMCVWFYSRFLKELYQPHQESHLVDKNFN